MTRNDKINILCIAIIFLLVNCGNAIQVKETKEISEKKTGIYVYANHIWNQWALYFTAGLRGNIGSKEDLTIPWRELVFIESEPGIIQYSLRMTYLNGGKKEGCLNLKKGKIIYIKYKSPFWVTSEGNVKFEDIETGLSDNLEVNCK